MNIIKKIAPLFIGVCTVLIFLITEDKISIALRLPIIILMCCIAVFYFPILPLRLVNENGKLSSSEMRVAAISYLLTSVLCWFILILLFSQHRSTIIICSVIAIINSLFLIYLLFKRERFTTKLFINHSVISAFYILLVTFLK